VDALGSRLRPLGAGLRHSRRSGSPAKCSGGTGTLVRAQAAEDRFGPAAGGAAGAGEIVKLADGFGQRFGQRFGQHPCAFQRTITRNHAHLETHADLRKPLPSTHHLYAAGVDSGTVEVIDTSTNTDVYTLSGGFGIPGGVVVDPTTKRIYVSSWNIDTVTVIHDGRP
jgi:YVTN family beta-propeller protein